jgi:hypothetical protein
LTDNTSETISVEEYIGADRNQLGDLSILRPGEEHADIIRVDHTRCSDGARTEVAFFVRLPDTGLLRPINMRAKQAGDVVQELVADNAQFHKWAKGRQFTQTELVKARAAAFPANVSERDTKAFFSEAIKADVFRESGKRRGHPLYEWKPAPAELSGAVPRTTRAPLHHSKKLGEKHV